MRGVTAKSYLPTNVYFGVWPVLHVCLLPMSVMVRYSKFVCSDTHVDSDYLLVSSHFCSKSLSGGQAL